MAIKELLIGHTSPETALIVEDYPFGFRLRCKIRYWLEYKPAHGFRFVSQTTNPKRAGEVWNKPKASTYFPVGFMYLNEDGHCKYACHSAYNLDNLETWVETYAVALQSPEHQQAINYLRKLRDASSRVAYKIAPSQPVSLI